MDETMKERVNERAAQHWEHQCVAASTYNRGKEWAMESEEEGTIRERGLLLEGEIDCMLLRGGKSTIKAEVPIGLATWRSLVRDFSGWVQGRWEIKGVEKICIAL